MEDKNISVGLEKDKRGFFRKNLIWIILIIIPFLIAGIVLLFGIFNYQATNIGYTGNYGGLNCFFQEYCGGDFVWGVMTYNDIGDYYYQSSLIYLLLVFLNHKLLFYHLLTFFESY